MTALDSVFLTLEEANADLKVCGRRPQFFISVCLRVRSMLLPIP